MHNRSWHIWLSPSRNKNEVLSGMVTLELSNEVSSQISNISIELNHNLFVAITASCTITDSNLECFFLHFVCHYHLLTRELDFILATNTDLSSCSLHLLKPYLLEMSMKCSTCSLSIPTRTFKTRRRGARYTVHHLKVMWKLLKRYCNMEHESTQKIQNGSLHYTELAEQEIRYTFS